MFIKRILHKKYSYLYINYLFTICIILTIGITKYLLAFYLYNASYANVKHVRGKVLIDTGIKWVLGIGVLGLDYNRLIFPS